MFFFCLSIEDADGDYQITSRAKAQIRYDGTVQWVSQFYFKSKNGNFYSIRIHQ